MKKSILFFALFLFVFACKKKDSPEPETQPEPEKTCNLTLKIQRFDSLGDIEADHSGVSVNINMNGQAVNITGTTSTSGVITFPNVPARTVVVPLLFKTGYDAAPFIIDLSAAVDYTVNNIPVAQISPFKVNGSSFSTQFVDKDSITISLTLNNPVPSGKTLKLAVMTTTSTNASPTNYFSSDIIPITSSTIVKKNIAKLPDLQAKLNTLPAGSIFYIKATVVSYGLYNSNMFNAKVLLGDSEPHSPLSTAHTKNW